MSIFDKIKKKPTVRIEDVPCYQCICLALCRRRDLLDLEKDCSLINKYYRARPRGISSGVDYKKWALLVKVLKE